MSERLMVLVWMVFAGFALSPDLGAQASPQTTTGAESKPATWDSIPPIKPSYAGKKSAPAPRRDISGIWDAAEADGGRQPSGALEHPALLKPRGQGIEAPLAGCNVGTGIGRFQGGRTHARNHARGM